MKVIKAFRSKRKHSFAGMNDFPADYYLLDSWSEGYGGSGTAFPWEWIEGLDASKMILSGGLRVENVVERSGGFVRSLSTSVAGSKRVQVLRIMENSKTLSMLPKVPDRRGHFGVYGGRYVAET